MGFERYRLIVTIDLNSLQGLSRRTDMIRFIHALPLVFLCLLPFSDDAIRSVGSSLKPCALEKKSHSRAALQEVGFDGNLRFQTNREGCQPVGLGFVRLREAFIAP